MANNDHRPDGNVIDREDTAIVTKPKTKKPSMYHVVLLNDDFTPMEFVVALLKTVFHREDQAAIQIMLEVHQKGRGIAGTYNYEVAETKVITSMELARRQEFPLQVTMEKA